MNRHKSNFVNFSKPLKPARVFYLTSHFFVLFFLSLFAPNLQTFASTYQNSILVIAVDNLGYQDMMCDEYADESANASSYADFQTGFEVLCQQAHRFTHAYTTSTLSGPALASVLTGLYPFEHRVRDNSSNYLSAQHITIVEKALQHGMRTGFWSGGAPIWRSLGLNQGFEIYDDHIRPSLQQLYRPASENVRLFLHWWNSEIESKEQSYFALLHLNDIQFVDVPTVTDEGEIRPMGRDGQLEEINESLGTLFKTLKKSPSWQKTLVVLVGLNGSGKPTDRTNEFGPLLPPKEDSIVSLRLGDDTARVALMIKPLGNAETRYSHKQSVNPMAVDDAVGLIDLAPTILEAIGEKWQRVTIEKPSESEQSLINCFGEPINLLDQDLNTHSEFLKNRKIWTESAWAKWRVRGDLRVAIRQGPYIYRHRFPNGDIFDGVARQRPLRLAGTSVDALQAEAFRKEVKKCLSTIPLSQNILSNDILKWNLSQSFGILNRQAENFKVDTKSSGQEPWVELPVMEMLNQALQYYNNEWKLDPQLMAWSSRLQMHNIRLNASKMNMIFYPLVFSGRISEQKANLDFSSDRFARESWEKELSTRVAQANQMLGWTWDLNTNLPLQPEAWEMNLAMPENISVRETLEKKWLRISRQRGALSEDQESDYMDF